MRLKTLTLICAALVFWPLMLADAGQSSSWAYTTSTDSMTDGTVKLASVRSTNTVTFGFPYGGPQRATLMLFKHPRYGENVILTIERGQFLCSFDNCTALVRFDEAEPSRWRAVATVYHSTGALSITSVEAFIARLRDANVVRIAAQFFQEGEPVFIFNVAGLVW